MSDHFRVAVEPESELGEVVRTYRVTVKDTQELVGKDHIRRQLAHGIYLELILALHQAVLGHQGNDPFPLLDGAAERDHGFDIGEPHVLAGTPEGEALEA